MNEPASSPTSGSEPPEAIVAKRRGISIVWLIPLVALLIGAFLAYKAYTSQGPTITITFDTAEGLEAGKTKLRYLDDPQTVTTGREWLADGKGLGDHPEETENATTRYLHHLSRQHARGVHLLPGRARRGTQLHCPGSGRVCGP